jgi:pantoate--beta-alanine ligase
VQTIAAIEPLRRCLDSWRGQGGRIALVPTMGNLHRGHLQLVEHALALADRVVASLFVNPLQFDRAADLAAYPRTLEADLAALEALGVDLVFCPDVGTVYPRGLEHTTQVEVPGLSDILCGASRPGHFRGVATVVTKLFNLIRPHWAVFGEKDYQQLVLIRRLAEDLNLPIEIVGVPTVREPDGLAMSSRNGYLSQDERARAPALYETLRIMAAALRGGARDYAALEREGAERLRARGLAPDYVSVRRQGDLGPARPDDARLVILAAAWLGKARLIDNLVVTAATLPVAPRIAVP